MISEASVSVVLLADGLRKDWRSLSQPEPVPPRNANRPVVASRLAPATSVSP